MSPRLSWLIAVTLRRTRIQWRLLGGVLIVALLASTLVTSLGLLSAATEESGVRRALEAVPDSSVSMNVHLASPIATIADARAATDSAIANILGTGVTATSSSTAVSPLSLATIDDPPDGLPVLTYFSERDGIRDHATLESGEWAGDVVAGGPVSVTLPAPAAGVAGLAIGDDFTVDVRGSVVAATITGLYSVNDPAEEFWATDALAGAGSDPEFPNPTVEFFQPTTAFGPLIVADGALAGGEIPVANLDFVYQPDFSAVTVDELPALLERLSGADTDLVLDTGRIANSISYGSDAVDSLSGIIATLVSTRSTVLVVSLLLAVLAIAALAQTARVFSDARATERLLMTARGASGGHLLALAAVEAVLVGVVVAAVSPPLAGLVYRVLAAQPPMRAAGMPAAIDVPLASWITAAAAGLAFVIVLLVPLLVPLVLSLVGRRTVAGEAPRSRQRAASGIMRSGLDLALVVVAGIAFWQLQSYRTPVVEGSFDPTIDLVLVAGPALALVAAALVCVRLIPALSRLIDAAGSTSRRLGISLAAWEIGRRAKRATAAVLLLSLTLAVGTFGLTFLTTWKQSQLDQAAFAVGAPVTVPVAPDRVSGQAASLAEGAVGVPQPVIHRGGTVRPRTTLEIPGLSEGTSAEILALTPGARELLDRGRLSELGGARVNGDLASAPDVTGGIDLPGDVRGISARVKVSADGATGVAADLTAVIEDGSGLLSTVALKPADNAPVMVGAGEYPVTADLALAEGSEEATGPLRLVGIQATFRSSEKEPVKPELPRSLLAELLVGEVSVLGADDGAGTALQITGDSGWTPFTTVKKAGSPTAGAPPEGWQFVLEGVVPADVLSLRQTLGLVAWNPVADVPAVLSDELAETLSAGPGLPLALSTRGVLVPISVVRQIPLVPGAAGSSDLDAVGSGLAPTITGDKVVIVDQSLLARYLIQTGATGTFADEWWVDVTPASAQAYVDAHPVEAGIRSSELIGLQLQQGPLRVATQAALWLTIVAGALLAAVGFIVHTAATLRARRLELAQLRAIGFSRAGLVRLIAGESALMSALGALFGVVIGLLLVILVGPLVVVSPDGSPPVPGVIVQVPWLGIAALVLLVAVVLALIVAVVARVQKFVDPAELLREGGAS